MPIIGAILKRSLTLAKKIEQKLALPASEYQYKVLRRLIAQAASTDFGKYYNFEKLQYSPNLIEDFAKTVPIFDYDRIYDAWWHKSLDCKPDVCWPGTIKYFALSSGTSGSSSKYIPITTDMQRSMRRAALKMTFCLTNFDFPPHLYTKDMLMIGGSSDLIDKGGYYVGDLSGINAKEPPFWLKNYYRPGSNIAKINDWEDRINEIAKHALDWDVAVLTGIPSWVQLTIERIIEYHKLNNIHEIWPNLSMFVHGGVAFEPYRGRFEKMMTKPLVNMDTYLASEGFIAFQRRPDTEAMALVLNNAIYYEFIPFNSDNFDGDGELKPEAKAVQLSEVKLGEEYAIILSTCAGAWRYLIGDVIRFTDLANNEIILTGRTKHFLSICGEHLSVNNMNHAIIATQRLLDVDVPEFTVYGVKSGNYFAHKWYIGSDSGIDEGLFAKTLDEQLQLINDDYRTERGSVLHSIQVQVIPTQIFYKWLEAKGKVGQSKVPRVMSESKIQEWEQFIKSSPIKIII
ncbi:MAG: GH3 auxin-responsive promoter family protein [Saprospiraceae bacterium]|nr:GH3 auxin-responsive promoter family protein [Saprospiraceae bacterium]